MGRPSELNIWLCVTFCCCITAGKVLTKLFKEPAVVKQSPGFDPECSLSVSSCVLSFILLLRFFNLHLEMNLLVQRNTKWQLVLQLKLCLRFERGSKCQILGSLTDEASKLYSCSRDHRLELQCMQTPLGVLYKLHMVSFHSALMKCFPLRNFLTIPLHFWQVGV